MKFSKHAAHCAAKYISHNDLFRLKLSSGSMGFIKKIVLLNCKKFQDHTVNLNFQYPLIEAHCSND